MGDPFDIRQSQLRGYLREFYVKPDMNPRVWAVAKSCMEDKKVSAFGIKFVDDASMRQFCLAVLLQGKQLNWESFRSYYILQANLGSEKLLTDYSDYDVVFIQHDRGTMKNAIMGATINQVCILRSPKKTFFLDRGGPPLADLVFPVGSIFDLGNNRSGLSRDEVI